MCIWVYSLKVRFFFCLLKNQGGNIVLLRIYLSTCLSICHLPTCHLLSAIYLSICLCIFHFPCKRKQNTSVSFSYEKWNLLWWIYRNTMRYYDFASAIKSKLLYQFNFKENFGQNEQKFWANILVFYVSNICSMTFCESSV